MGKRSRKEKKRRKRVEEVETRAHDGEATKKKWLGRQACLWQGNLRKRLTAESKISSGCISHWSEPSASAM